MPFSPVLPDTPEPKQIGDALLEAGLYLHGLRAKPNKGDESWERDVRSVTEFINHYDPILTAMTAVGRARPMGNGHSAPPAAGTQDHGGALDMRSIGQRYVTDDKYRNFVGENRQANSYLELEYRGVPYAQNELYRNEAQFRTLINVSGTGGSGGAEDFMTVAQPLPPVPRQRRMFVRDLLNVQTTQLSHVPYIVETNPVGLEGGASAVAEASAKPEVTMDWEPKDAPVRKIAAWVPVTEEAIADAPTLRGYIDGRLTYMLAIREEAEVLNGPGTGVRLLGILQQTGLQTIAVAGSDGMQAIGRAIGMVEAVDGEADGMAFHPTDFWEMITTRWANQFDGAGTVGAGTTGFPFISPNVGPWGLPAVRSRGVPQGTGIVGSWRLGATLFDRLQTVIRVGNQHSTFFTENKVAILAEERIALAVHRPDFFVSVTGL